MTRRTRSVLVATCVLVLVLCFFGLPLLKIFLDLHYGRQVQESLLVSLRANYPDVAFEKGGVGYTRPTIVIRVSSPVDPALRNELLVFVASELSRRRFGGNATVHFLIEGKRLTFNRSGSSPQDWDED